MDNNRRKEVIDYINSQLEDGYIDLGLHDQEELTILRQAMNALRCLEQYRWERDIAILQLEELGIGLGEKIDGVYLTKQEYEDLLDYKVWLS